MDRVIVLAWEKVSLVIPEKRDLDVMYKEINNYNLSRFMWPVKFYTKEKEENYLNSVLTWDKRFFIIVDNSTWNTIWWIWFNEYSDLNRNWEIWFMLYWDENIWKWFGTEALELFLKYAFDILWYHKVKLWVYANNPRAIRVYEKYWFKTVWVFKDEAYIMWEYVDSIKMEIMRNEWKGE